MLRQGHLASYDVCAAGRKRSRRTMQPKDMKELEVDTTDAIFSSSQLIREQSKAGWCSPDAQLT